MIVAPVRPGRPELIQQAVIGREQIDAVETGRLAAPRSLGKAVDDFLDFALTHGVAAVGIVVGGQARGRPVRHEGQVRITVLADVVQLLQDRGAVGVNGVGDLAEMRDNLVVTVAKVATR